MKKIEFDELIKRNIIEEKGMPNWFGYDFQEGNKSYDNYYNAEEFSFFIEEMKKEPYKRIYCCYSKGSGQELEIKRGKYGKMPPKMASVASSSRFCYLALRDGAEGLGGSGLVKFEHECKIEGVYGRAPQLDAYVPNENIYVEVKCHEIFDSHKIKMKMKYWDFIYGRGNCFGFEERDKNQGPLFEIPLSVFGLKNKSSLFDTKQFLCHLLGISSQENGINATLVYLFFKPKASTPDMQKQIDDVFARLKEEISTIFNSNPIQRFIGEKRICLKAIAEESKVMEPLNENNIVALVDVPWRTPDTCK